MIEPGPAEQPGRGSLDGAPGAAAGPVADGAGCRQDAEHGAADLLKVLGHCLTLRQPAAKVAAVLDAARRHAGGQLVLDADAQWTPVPVGRPQLPRLVAPARVPRRRLGSPAGHGAFVHAIAHIEFNAINLALDAAHRFRGLPAAYYDDWVRVAAEEASHFQMLSVHLADLGFAYGDFDAHDGLWTMAEQTAADPLTRMALVPRVLEARGLDVTPAMIRRLDAIGDTRGAAILTTIAREEEGHVAVGSRWFRHLCEQRGLPPQETFEAALRAHLTVSPKGPFHRAARLRAGFTEAELTALEALARKERAPD